MRPNLSSLGRWPVEGKKARQEKTLFHLTPEQYLPLIHGKEKHVLFSFMVSNDYMHAAILTIPVGGHSEVESHQGDEALYVLEGDLVVRLVPEEESKDKKSAVYQSHHIYCGEKCLIPEGVKHQYLNFTTRVVKVFVAMGPGV